jgi:hypothetical protein
MTKKIIPVGAKRRSTLKAEELAGVIDAPVKTWLGRCHEIAGLTLAAGELGKISVSGTLRYGMWVGPTHFKGRTLTHHGWIEREAAKLCPACGEHFNISGPCCDKNGAAPAVVIDPTRWVFENVKPYIFEGYDAEGYYDVAGNRFANALRKPYPIQPEPWHPKESVDRTLTIEAATPVLIHLATLIHSSCGLVVGLNSGQLTLPVRGMHWLANAPVDNLGPHALGFYKALEKADLVGLVPQDNWELVMGDGFYGQREKVKARVQKGRKK